MHEVGVGCFLQVSLCDHNIRNNNKNSPAQFNLAPTETTAWIFFFFRCIRVVLKNTDCFVCSFKFVTPRVTRAPQLSAEKDARNCT